MATLQPSSPAPLPSSSSASSAPITSRGTPPSPPPRLYFAYGSNLSTTQMSLRCPTAHLHTPPLAKLHDWEWFIAERGYASIRPAEGTGKTVYGLLWCLDEEAEDMLDLYEGVGRGREGKYYKEVVGVYVIARTGEEEGEREKVEVEVLVYIDCSGEEGELADGYAYRLKRGVLESARLGLSVEGSFGRWGEEVMAEDMERRRVFKTRKRVVKEESVVKDGTKAGEGDDPVGKREDLNPREEEKNGVLIEGAEVAESGGVEGELAAAT